MSSVSDFLLFESLNSEPYPYQEEVKYSGLDHIYTFSEGEHEFKLHFEKQANLGRNIFRAYVGQKTTNLKTFKKVVTRFKDANKVAATLVAIIGDFLSKYKSKTDGIAFGLPIAAFGNYSNLVNKVIARKFTSQLNLVDSEYQPPEYKEDGLHYVYYTVKPKTVDVFNGKYVKGKLVASSDKSAASAKQPDPQAAPPKPVTELKPAVSSGAATVGLSNATTTKAGVTTLKKEYMIGSNPVFFTIGHPADADVKAGEAAGYSLLGVTDDDRNRVYVFKKSSSNISDQLLTAFGMEGLKKAAKVSDQFKSTPWTFATDDYQRRGGNYPKSGVPDTIDVYPASVGTYPRPQGARFSFKNTSPSQAVEWVKRFMDSKGLKYDRESLSGSQTGDYDDDWVEVYVNEFKPSDWLAASKGKVTAPAPTPKQTAQGFSGSTKSPILLAKEIKDIYSMGTGRGTATKKWLNENGKSLKWEKGDREFSAQIQPNLSMSLRPRNITLYDVKDRLRSPSNTRYKVFIEVWMTGSQHGMISTIDIGSAKGESQESMTKVKEYVQKAIDMMAKWGITAGQFDFAY